MNPARRSLAPIARTLRLFVLSALGCAELHPGDGGSPDLAQGVRDAGAIDAAGTAVFPSNSHSDAPQPSPASPSAGGVAPIDAMRCNANGGRDVVLFEPRVLGTARTDSDPCVLRVMKWPSPFELERLRVEIDKMAVNPDSWGGVDARGGGYVIEADVLRFTGQACEYIRDRDGGPVSISLRYGPCQIWE